MSHSRLEIPYIFLSQCCNRMHTGQSQPTRLLISRTQGLCFIHLSTFSSQQSAWHIVGTQQIFVKQSFNFFFYFLGLHPQHMEVPRLGVQLELQLLAYTTATATSDPSRVWDPHHSPRQCQILNLLSKARNRTRNLMVPSLIYFH